MIELSKVTKRYGANLAVDDLSFSVRPGRVTGFLGPNGAGKSTTMRVILGLDRPTEGRALVNGRPYVEIPAPLREVGALLDPGAAHPSRSARNHLRAVARSNQIPDQRVDEVLDHVGLAPVGDQRVGAFSLGMRQRLGIAAALIGDPGILVLDEPVNGLDTEGIRWIRDLLKDLADEGRTVFLSSHVMSEMELTADRLIVIGRGRLLADMTVPEFIDAHSRPATVVGSPAMADLRPALDRLGAAVETHGVDRWRVTGVSTESVGAAAADRGAVLHELRPVRPSLEDVYSTLTATSLDHRSRPPSVDRPGQEVGS